MKPHRILFIAPTRIGDAVLASAVLRHIAATQPQAKVTIATSELSAPLYENYPLLERIIRLRKKKYSGHWIDLLREVILTRWHSVWDIRGSATAYMLFTRRRHIFRGSTEPISKLEQFAKQMHTPPLPLPMLWPGTTHRAQAESMMPEGTRYLIIAPTANWAPKQWPMDHFITLGHRLLAEGGLCHGWRPVIFSAGHERLDAIKVVEALHRYNPIDLTEGHLPLLAIYACMQRADAFIGNDSGLMHMAAASGVPTLALYGPTAHAIATFYPHGPRGRAVVEPTNIMENLTPERVAEELGVLLAA